MKEDQIAMMHFEVAQIISGAPFPSSKSLTKARRVVEYLLNRANLIPVEDAFPEGFVLVPEDPTDQMVLAAKASQGDHDSPEAWLEWEGVAAAKQYRAMIAERPRP